MRYTCPILQDHFGKTKDGPLFYGCRWDCLMADVALYGVCNGSYFNFFLLPKWIKQCVITTIYFVFICFFFIRDLILYSRICEILVSCCRLEGSLLLHGWEDCCCLIWKLFLPWQDKFFENITIRKRQLLKNMVVRKKKYLNGAWKWIAKI